jgi:lipopolysaccharide transport system ATP-binding protein
MNDLAIRVSGLSKKYKIGKPERYKTLRDTLANSVTTPIHIVSNLMNGSKRIINNGSDNTIWALKDVSFEVRQGEVIGIIGRNGAGKSTLLKILSQITEPTDGQVEIHGRVGSLLEIGTGFHPELTGRENVYLYGAILGMKKIVIDRKFDEIVAFTEIEKFVDTPVKHFSSGMYMRLAFSVAAHLEPEILLVDEVLAVGDFDFQKKCLGKMENVANDGRTVLFVSHNLGAITNLCTRALLMDCGYIVHDSTPTDAVSKYLNTKTSNSEGQIYLKNNSKDAYFANVSIQNSDGHPTTKLSVTSSFKLIFEYKVLRPINGLEVGFELHDRYGSLVFFSEASKNNPALNESRHDAGTYVARIQIPPSFIAPGNYTISISLHRPNIEVFDHRDNVIGFDIVETGSGAYRYKRNVGSVLVDFEWELERVGFS